MAKAKRPTIADLLKRIEKLEEAVAALTPPPPQHHDAMLHKGRATVMTEAASQRGDAARKKSGPRETRFTRNSIGKVRPDK